MPSNIELSGIEVRLVNEMSRERVLKSYVDTVRDKYDYNLIPELLNLVDEKLIAMRPAVEISYFTPEAQMWLFEAIEFADATPSHAQTLQMRKFAEQAILSMVDSNLQRDEILPSEKAFAYKMRLEAMNRQGQRTDLTSTPTVEKLSGKDSQFVTAS